MSNELLEKVFKESQQRIYGIDNKIDKLEQNSVVAQFANTLIYCTLAEALELDDVPRTMRFITNARKSGEGAGTGTGLPAFYNDATNSWVDFLGNAITV